ncbi:MAG: chromate efflux transporter [Acidimicrobiia bacterium]|nr:chromate efflux transporter [Acidimicrobiia bacterium]
MTAGDARDPASDTTQTTGTLLPLRTATRAWFGISLQTFGGPAGQIAVMHRKLVDELRWVSERRFLHALNYCMLLPGPEAQQLAIYLGWLLNGWLGGLIAGVLFVLPGFIALMALSAIYAGFGDTLGVEALFAGVAPAVLAIVASAVMRVGTRSLNNPLLIAFALASFVALALFRVPFPLIVLGAGLAGFIGDRLRPDLFAAGGHGREDPDAPAPLISDDALHGANPSWGRAAGILAGGLVIWAVPIIALALAFGGDSIFVEQGKFFSGTAVVTFGGAYAVLAYIAQRAVYTYGWLAPGEMVKGLAMAETTPGPLIQVVQFVAFMGAYRNPGSLNPWVAAVIAACLVTWVTYVPCFLWIFLGAPSVEALRGNERLSAALTAITAAVVGVIANLAVFFAVHTLFSRVDDGRRYGFVHLDVPDWTTVSPRALAVGALAFYLIFARKWSVLSTIGLCALVGGAIHLLAAQ